MFALRDGDQAEQHVRIEPAILTLRVRMGDRPVAHADVELLNWAARWSAAFRTGDDGDAIAEFWQAGEFGVGVKTESFSDPFINGTRTIEAGHDATLDVIVPDRSITAKVVTSDGKPVAHALVTMWQTREGNRMRVAAFTNDAGTTTFTPALQGPTAIDVAKEGFAPPDTVAFDVAESEHERTVTITLGDAASRVLTVVDMRNTPIAGATVIHASNDGVRLLGATAIDGTLPLSIREPARGVLFVVPPSGSFGYLRLATVDGDAVKLVVPPPVAMLTVKTESTSGELVPNVWFAVQYDGMLLPIEVLSEMQRLQGVAFTTNAAGVAWLPRLPAGYYELFPLIGGMTLNRLFASGDPEPAAKVQVNAGEQAVVMKFKPAK